MTPLPLRLAMLNAMADRDPERSLARQSEWGIRDLDLKDCLWGRDIIDLDPGQAERLARLAERHGMAVHCLSSQLFHADVRELAGGMAAEHARRAERLVALARILRPRLIRFLAPQADDPAATRLAVAAGAAELEPLFDGYRAAIDACTAAGFGATIENEACRCLLGEPQAVVDFFARLRRDGSATFTWDVQNQWQNGTFPSLEAYRRMRRLIGYVHLKGGRSEPDGPRLRWRSLLEDASWPVAGIVRTVLADGCSPVICLNPSHGEAHPDWPTGDAVVRDLAFLRRLFPSPEVPSHALSA